MYFISNNIHEKITQFWLAEKGVQLFCNTSAKCVTRETRVQIDKLQIDIITKIRAVNINNEQIFKEPPVYYKDFLDQ